ncbi:MAG: hydrogenase 4 subunit B [Mesorhizobium sp.]|nr:hydrogenase 4 subunit B [Mesorhizobium sp.]
MQALMIHLPLVGVLLAAAVLATAIARSASATPVVYAICAVASAAGLAAALLSLTGGLSAAPLVLPLGLPWVGAHFRIDALAAFFLVVVNLGGTAASIYGLGYGHHEDAPHRVLPFFPAFLAGMNLVVMADDAFTFLLSWEFMSLASWALVLAHHREAANARAAYIYLLMASFGTMALLLAFGLLAGPGGEYAFASIREADRAPAIAALALVLMLVGAGSKAGLAPLHVWLPLAHPAAPSHVSALMSGVMTKVAIYGFIRVVFDLLGEPAWWSSVLLLALGGATAVLGILHAMMETDLKRLLAYSTIENIGVIFAGLGLSLAFEANGMGWAAALALVAALFHVFNHSLFKSLLFFGAGAVLTATGQRDMDRLGGLIHRMPATSLAFLVGCVAISALPPFNGFVSEWMIFQAILQSPNLPGWGLKIMVPAVGGLLALAAALAAACFVRAFGVVFLGRPRSTVAEQAQEVDHFSIAAMAFLAALCLLAGILPGFVIDSLAPITQALVGGSMPDQTGDAWLSIVPIAEGRSSYNGLLVFVFIAVSAWLAAYLVHRFASRELRRGPAWDCGFPEPSPATQYTGGSFAQPIRRVFGTMVFRARETVDMPPPGSTAPARHRVEMRDLVWDWLFAPIAGAVDFAAGHLNRLQFLTIRRYLSFVFLALITLLLVLALWT